jgi:anti-sigma regulatory factor (Ser/Thr protein kinase)
MEGVKFLNETLSLAVQDQSRTADARRVARELASDLGYDDTGAERVAIVATELCTNLLKHANGGYLLISNGATDSDGRELVQIAAVDRGPGIQNVDASFRDGFTTASSPGNGLGAVARLSLTVDVYSVVGQGTVVLVRIGREKSRAGRQQPTLHDVTSSTLRVRKPGQDICGDDSLIINGGHYSIFVVADGLGHGPDAARASGEAMRIAERNSSLRPKDLVEAIHAGIRSTRGAAVAVARIDFDRGVISFSGAGNIAATVVQASAANQHLVSVNGTAGHEIRRLQEYSYPWTEGALLVMHSDGLSARWDLSQYPGLLERDPALIAGTLYRDFSRHTDDTTVVVARPAAVQ